LRDYIVSFAVALAASLPLTFAVRGGARRLKLVARPRADRWHKRPTALFGGVAIFVAFLVSYLVRWPTPFPGGKLMVLSAAGMFMVGLVDDLLTLKPYAKLVGQIVFATIATTGGVRLHWLPSAVLDQALTIFWLVGITNAVNLLDNLDGVAGGVAVIASGYMIYFCHVSGQSQAACLAASFCGAVLGFLVFNVNPASIFMGDCGSLFLGFSLGGLATATSAVGTRQNVMAVLWLPVLILTLPIVDTTLVTISRKMNGRRVSQGGRDHTSHRLVALGLSERTAALVLWGLSMASGGLAVLVRHLALPVSVFLVPACGMALLLLLVVVGKVKVYEPIAAESEGGGRALVPTLADFAYKRRIFEVLNDLVVVLLAYYGAFLLRFDGLLVEPYYSRFVSSLPAVVAVQSLMMLVLGLYRGLWRYTSMNDLATLIRATGGAWIASVAALSLAYRLEGFSRGVLLMDAVLLLFGVAGSRIFFRFLRMYVSRFKRDPEARRVLIYGAGDGGELLVRELLNNRNLGLTPVGFLDDDPAKHGRMIHGLRVIGDLGTLKTYAGDESVDEVVISTSKIDPERSAILGLLSQTVGIRTRRMRIALD
jgi:UDP-GlcNAc:undecaprenyl-phosphate GlcNAc-1-phosphate transferase